MTRIAEELITIEKMISIYCNRNRHSPDGLCGECGDILEYAKTKLSGCTFGDSKPTCRKCRIHCYSDEKRRRIREIMKYSGPLMIWYHPFLAVKHAFREIRSE
jgi:predicted amidophosphoribosyltransferase